MLEEDAEDIRSSTGPRRSRVSRARDARPQHSNPRVFGPYRIVRLLGEGGIGRGLPRRARRPPEPGRHQVPARRLALAGATRTIRQRAAHARAAQSPLHRAPVRRRRARRWHAVVRHGVRRRIAAHGVLRAHGLSIDERVRLFAPCARRCIRTPARRHPSRSEAVQHPGEAGRNGPAARLRHRQAARRRRRRCGPDADGAAADDAGLRLARADAGRARQRAPTSTRWG